MDFYNSVTGKIDQNGRETPRTGGSGKRKKLIWQMTGNDSHPSTDAVANFISKREGPGKLKKRAGRTEARPERRKVFGGGPDIHKRLRKTAAADPGESAVTKDSTDAGARRWRARDGAEGGY